MVLGALAAAKPAAPGPVPSFAPAEPSRFANGSTLLFGAMPVPAAAGLGDETPPTPMPTPTK